MTRQQFLIKLGEILELPAGFLQGTEKLEDLETWDSLAMMNLIAMVSKDSGLTLSPRQIAPCVTVNDLASLAVPGPS